MRMPSLTGIRRVPADSNLKVRVISMRSLGSAGSLANGISFPDFLFGRRPLPYAGSCLVWFAKEHSRPTELNLRLISFGLSPVSYSVYDSCLKSS